ncbi:SPFH domain-containing protein [Chitinophaga rhizophila]|uniref:SPFH domain-containing protein n=1 Tax=Chitinophaga rhizophila TaxID=2866212 RepID=A0ABS7GBB7_9BACT|nr:SPFH domain-containing protein [Chitinophaga rhizophila]MBW8684954.1 SPFH domain-containing protein [Chitinophaga rhizophila]
MNLPFIEIIEWTTKDPNLLMWKFPHQEADIKNGAKLIVRESELALILSEGKLADVFGPGTHTLTTENIPLLTKLKGWKYGFQGPFKVDVYYLSSRQFVNLKWGTPAPIMLTDQKFGQVRVRAFGSYNVRIADAAKFFREYAGTLPYLSIVDLQHKLRDYIAPQFGEALSAARIQVLEVAGNLQTLNHRIRPLIQPYFDTFGIEVTEFVITSVTLPDDVASHFDKVTSMNMVSDMDAYMKFNQANALGTEGTAMNDAAQQGAAMAYMVSAIQAQHAQPPPAEKQDDITTRLKQLKALHDEGLIDAEEYKEKKAAIISKL